MVAPAAGSASGPAARASSKRVLSGSSASAGRGRDTRAPCPDVAPRTRTRPVTGGWRVAAKSAMWSPRRRSTPGSPMSSHRRPRGSARGRSAVEDLLDDGAGVPGGAPVVVQEPAGVQVGAVAAGAGDAGELDPRPGQLVARPAAHQEDPVARPRGQLPGAPQRLDLAGVQKTLVAEHRQRLDRRGHPQPGHLGGVLQLQQLDGALDVGQPPPPPPPPATPPPRPAAPPPPRAPPGAPSGCTNGRSPPPSPPPPRPSLVWV